MDKTSHNLKHFEKAQAKEFSGYKMALKEVQEKQKMTCWIWYIFPQYKGLGKSSTSIEYSIKSKKEALEYLHHPILGTRLTEITSELLLISDRSLFQVFRRDEKKIKSCMTLFNEIQSDTDIFNLVLKQHFKGERCETTIKNLHQQK